MTGPTGQVALIAGRPKRIGSLQRFGSRSFWPRKDLRTGRAKRPTPSEAKHAIHTSTKEADERLVNIRPGSEEGGILTSVYQAYAADY